MVDRIKLKINSWQFMTHIKVNTKTYIKTGDFFGLHLQRWIVCRSNHLWRFKPLVLAKRQEQIFYRDGWKSWKTLKKLFGLRKSNYFGKITFFNLIRGSQHFLRLTYEPSGLMPCCLTFIRIWTKSAKLPGNLNCWSFSNK